MSRFSELREKLKQQIKFSASNPLNFEELWSFNATRIQLYSLILIFSMVLGFIFALLFLKGPFATYFTKNDVSIERKKLEDQDKKLIALQKQIDDQNEYAKSVRKIILGEIVDDTLTQDVPEVQRFSPADIDAEQSENEQQLSDKVKDDLRTKSKKKTGIIAQYFVPPVKGVVSQKFDALNHPAVDIVTSKDRTFVACLSGTVIYSGFTQKDGYILVIDHANGFISVYKHARTLLKKSGSKVQMNDPIGIVGNTGENSSGPHLHFELWYNQSIVNPMDYMRFD